ncbi:MAG: acyl-CoA desaturase, partial [Acidobacteriota bacterium]|nr:acyl-CoA desaturase [Acidobacteriota bacterium]
MQNVVDFQPAVATDRLNWSTIIGVSIFHLLVIPAFFMFSWTNLAVAVGIWWLAGSLGIGVGYH